MSRWLEATSVLPAATPIAFTPVVTAASMNGIAASTKPPVIFDRNIQVAGPPRRSASCQILPGSLSPGLSVSGSSFGPMPSKLVRLRSKP